MISHTDGFGKIITYTHDLPGRVETITDRLGNPTVFEYDERGNVLRKADARGGVTTFTYDANDNVLTETNALGKTSTYTYDANDHRTSSTDPLGNITQFTYNGIGKLLTATDALNQATTNTYDSGGNLLTTKDALNNTTSFIYSPFNGQRLSMTDALNKTTNYDYAGPYLIKETDPLGNETISITTPTAIAPAKPSSAPTLRVNSKQSRRVSNYNSLNRLTSMNASAPVSTLASYTYTLGAAGNRTAVTELSGRTVNYTYDDLYRLTSETILNDPHLVNGNINYGYDPVGNRLSRSSTVAPVPSQNSTYDANDRLTSDSYDNNGNTTSVSGNTYAYDGGLASLDQQ